MWGIEDGGGERKENKEGNENERWVWLIYGVGESHLVLSEGMGGSHRVRDETESKSERIS